MNNRIRVFYIVKNKEELPTDIYDIIRRIPSSEYPEKLIGTHIKRSESVSGTFPSGYHFVMLYFEHENMINAFAVFLKYQHLLNGINTKGDTTHD